MKKAALFATVPLIFLMAAACRSNSSPFSPTGGAELKGEGIKMTVSTSGQGTGVLTFLIELKNEGASSATLDFGSAQIFDIEVSGVFNRPVWKWSYDKYFAQVFCALELKPGEAYSYRADWHLTANDGAKVQPGMYKAKVWITNYPRDQDLSVAFLLTI
jgi:hypothetical protein